MNYISFLIISLYIIEPTTAKEIKNTTDEITIPIIHFFFISSARVGFSTFALLQFPIPIPPQIQPRSGIKIPPIIDTRLKVFALSSKSVALDFTVFSFSFFE